MKTVTDDTLRSEARTFRLRYRCLDCAHFDEPSRLCAEGFPNAQHRDASVDESPFIEFCKSFELGP